MADCFGAGRSSLSSGKKRSCNVLLLCCSRSALSPPPPKGSSKSANKYVLMASLSHTNCTKSSCKSTSDSITALSPVCNTPRTNHHSHSKESTISCIRETNNGLYSLFLPPPSTNFQISPRPSLSELSSNTSNCRSNYVSGASICPLFETPKNLTALYSLNKNPQIHISSLSPMPADCMNESFWNNNLILVITQITQIQDSLLSSNSIKKYPYQHYLLKFISSSW